MWRGTNCSGCKVKRKVKLKAGQHEKRTAVNVKGKKKVKLKAGQHLVDRERAATHQAPTTQHPPIDHPTITAAQQQYNSSGAARAHQSITAAYSSNTAVQRYTCGPVARQELGGIFTFFTILYLSGKSASRPRERLFMLPARGVGIRRR